MIEKIMMIINNFNNIQNMIYYSIKRCQIKIITSYLLYIIFAINAK